MTCQAASVSRPHLIAVRASCCLRAASWTVTCAIGASRLVLNGDLRILLCSTDLWEGAGMCCSPRGPPGVRQGSWCYFTHSTAMRPDGSNSCFGVVRVARCSGSFSLPGCSCIALGFWHVRMPTPLIKWRYVHHKCSEMGCDKCSNHPSMYLRGISCEKKGRDKNLETFPF